MYKVLSKDTIENEIIPYLSVAKRGYKTKSCLIEIVNCILYKLKTGVQWALLPVESLFSEVVLSYKTVFGHFRKWCKKGDWQDSWINILSNHKTHSCYLCSKRDVFKSSGFDFRSWWVLRFDLCH